MCPAASTVRTAGANFVGSEEVVAVVLGRETLSDCGVRSGAVTMNTTSSTSITSTNGVTLISLIIPI